jgi:hypothetical protein
MLKARIQAEATMAFDLEAFVGLRRFVYHLSDSANVSRLRRLRCIQSAAELLRLAGQGHLIRERRAKPVSVEVDGDTVVLRDQAPLIFANAALAPGWSTEDFTAHLNEHVYFWPGDSDGPVKAGARLHDHYLGDRPAVLRVPTPDLLAANGGQVPLFCPFNSGAPRKQAGVAVPRGPDLFLPAAEFPRTAGKVVELVFGRTVSLPDTTRLSVLRGEWGNL